MADELKLTVALRYSKGSVSEDADVVDLGIDVAGTQLIHNIQTAPITNDEALELGDVGAGGYVFMINRDATNFVEIRAATNPSADLIKLLPGDPCLFRITGDCAPYILADTATCELEYWLFEL